MRLSWNNKDIKLGVHSLTHFVLNFIILIQAGSWPLKMVSGFVCFSWFPYSLISSVFVKPKFIAFGTALMLSHNGVVFCFLETSFCILLVVLPRICERHSASPQNIIKRTGNIFLTSDFCSYGEHRQWGQRTMNTWWYISLHICSFYLFTTKRVKSEMYDWNKGPNGRISLVLQHQFQKRFF